MSDDKPNPDQAPKKIAEALGRLRGDVMPPITSQAAPGQQQMPTLRSELNLGARADTPAANPGALFGATSSYSPAGGGIGDSAGVNPSSDIPPAPSATVGEQPSDGEDVTGSSYFRAVMSGAAAAQPVLADADMGPPPLGGEYGRLDNDEARRRRNRRLAMIGGVAAVMVVLGLWIGARHHGDVPVITADTTPEKVKPADQGGLQVPNQNVQVLENMNGQAKSQGGETVMPPPEQPLASPAPVVTDQSATQGTPPAAPAPTDQAPQMPSVPAPDAMANAAPSEPAASAVPDANGSAMTNSQSTSSSDATAATNTQTAAKPAMLAPGGKVRVQLAAVKSEALAKAIWAKLQKAHPAELGNLTLTIEKVDKGTSGVFYRVQAGPLMDKAAAKSICAALSQQSQACLIAPSSLF